MVKQSKGDNDAKVTKKYVTYVAFDDISIPGCDMKAGSDGVNI